MSLFQSHKREFIRLVPIVAVASLILIPDASSSVVLFAIGIILALAGVSHILRKVLFPYVDMEIFALRAMESPLSASIVFASITGLLAVLVSSAVQLLH